MPDANLILIMIGQVLSTPFLVFGMAVAALFIVLFVFVLLKDLIAAAIAER